MNVLRVHRRTGFTQIPNEVLRDERLSWKARGVLCFLLSHSDGFRFNRDQLADAGPDGAGAVRSALKELTDAGYYRVDRHKDDRGRFLSVVTVTDTPGIDETPPLVGFPPADDGPAENVPVLEHQPEQDTLAPPARASEPEEQPARTVTEQADELTREWWERFDRPPLMPFIGARKIVEAALGKGWQGEEIRQALRRLPSVLTSWKLDQTLRDVVRVGPKHLGGFDPNAPAHRERLRS